jgi:hypothetical protein
VSRATVLREVLLYTLVLYFEAKSPRSGWGVARQRLWWVPRAKRKERAPARNGIDGPCVA